MLNYSTISPVINQLGLSKSNIVDWSVDLDLPQWDSYHHPGWDTIEDRRWLTDTKWTQIGEEQRIGFLMHLAEDSGVPVSHSPANEVWTDTWREAFLEAKCETWSTSPSINPYSGTYSQKMTTAYNQVISNANWFKNHHTYFPPFRDDYKTAGWAGIDHGQQIAEAMLLEYFATRDQLELTAVPEPATMTLVAFSAAALIRRRKR